MYLIRFLIDKKAVLSVNNYKRKITDELINVAAALALPLLWKVLHYIDVYMLDEILNKEDENDYLELLNRLPIPFR